MLSPVLSRLTTLAALLALMLGSSTAFAVKIHVRGAALVDGAVTSSSDGFILRGEVTDDAGAPIARAEVSARIVGADGRAAALPATPASCKAEDGGRSVRHPSPDHYVLETDERGAFCVSGASALPKGKLKLRFAPTRTHDAAEKEIDVELDSARLTRTRLAFVPAPDAIDLDRPTAAVSGTLTIPDRAHAQKRQGMPIVLEDEHGKRLGEAQTGGDGRARFELSTAALDGPGAGELRLRFEGTGTLAKAAVTQAVIRRAEVSLALAHPLEAADPDEGLVIDVDVTTSRGPVSGGVVEALRGGESVGAAPVEAGRAKVIAAFAARAGIAPLTLRYVPAAPWFRAGRELAVDAKIAGPGILRQLLLAAAVVAVAAWVVAGWRRAPKPPTVIDDGGVAPPSGRAGVQVVRASAGLTGWSGFVSDAHDGTPVAGARLRILVPSFEGEAVGGVAATDERGAFQLEGTHRSDARLVVESPTHSTYEQALPPPSVLSVALVTRRRALVDRLVRWARRQGSPFDVAPEPTPGHVRRAAARSSMAEVESWAKRLEHAAFGPEAVDESIEDEIREHEPKGRAPKP